MVPADAVCRTKLAMTAPEPARPRMDAMKTRRAVRFSRPDRRFHAHEPSQAGRRRSMRTMAGDGAVASLPASRWFSTSAAGGRLTRRWTAPAKAMPEIAVPASHQSAGAGLATRRASARTSAPSRAVSGAPSTCAARRAAERRSATASGWALRKGAYARSIARRPTNQPRPAPDRNMAPGTTPNQTQPASRSIPARNTAPTPKMPMA